MNYAIKFNNTTSNDVIKTQFWFILRFKFSNECNGSNDPNAVSCDTFLSILWRWASSFPPSDQGPVPLSPSPHHMTEEVVEAADPQQLVVGGVVVRHEEGGGEEPVQVVGHTAALRLEQHPGKHVLQSLVPLPALPGRDGRQHTRSQRERSHCNEGNKLIQWGKKVFSQWTKVLPLKMRGL